MERADRIAEVRARVACARGNGREIGLVATMGALHAGHGALIERARRAPDFLVVSIFVNAPQFERRDDYEAYTINLGQDLEFCRARGADLVFAPALEEMYPLTLKIATPGFLATSVEVAGLSDPLCGRFRPGHFRAVATVVAKLFHIVSPDRAYFGEKDWQQLAVIRRMVADLNWPLEIVAERTVREPDGLALSSRNRRLNAEERALAPLLYRALGATRDRIAAGCVSAAEAKAAGMALLAQELRIRVEYFEVVDPETLASVEYLAGAVRVVAAVWVGGTRLIDNVEAHG
jgi:pantoate--beta-alanine ligase